MRVYFTTTVATAEAILLERFTDLHGEFGMEGVYFASKQLDINDGFEGEVTLCVDVPDATMQQYDDSDTDRSYRLALIPAEVLNRLSPPQIYDHIYAGASRREILQSIQKWQQDADPSTQRHAQEMREAINFFDHIGWLTPLKLKEEKAE
jgi:hypothetical protein